LRRRKGDEARLPVFVGISAAGKRQEADANKDNSATEAPGRPHDASLEKGKTAHKQTTIEEAKSSKRNKRRS
jgi:hypothetical protein